MRSTLLLHLKASAGLGLRMEIEQGSLNVDERFIQPEPKCKVNIPKRLRLLAIEMRETADAMIDEARDGDWLLHAYELKGAAGMCQEWSRHIKKDK